jgi:hypothetical protein
MLRKKISKALERELYAEAGWRCAVPTCRESCSLEMAHIIPVSDGGMNTFENLLVLCANHHTRFDDPRDKRMTREQMIIIKKNLMVINGRYGHFEMRLIEHFSNTGDDSIFLHGREIDVMYLIKDGLLVEDGIVRANMIDFPPKKYSLTEAGLRLLSAWKSAELWDEKS